MLGNEVQILFELNHCDVTARPGHWLGLLVPGSHGARIQMPIQVRHGPIWATDGGQNGHHNKISLEIVKAFALSLASTQVDIGD